MSRNDSIDKVRDLNITRYGTEFDEWKFKKTLEEEIEELYQAIDDNDTNEFLDAAADSIVVLLGGIVQKGYDPSKVLNEVVKTITSREQDPEQKRAWLKDPSLQTKEKWKKYKNQSKNTLYAANFSKCRLLM